ncbi:hypothetical protein NDU88_002572 [Pleurodeles waltl]|uniref:Uncharacterized protein n=1 Tax=Pleurodeles waltl TaxID=8319 RepID=A0AAV7SEL2_PLEWA|nr:hypothetical protein NDU88_002572 [Pleurodeles waltl]
MSLRSLGRRGPLAPSALPTMLFCDLGVALRRAEVSSSRRVQDLRARIHARPGAHAAPPHLFLSSPLCSRSLCRSERGPGAPQSGRGAGRRSPEGAASGPRSTFVPAVSGGPQNQARSPAEWWRAARSLRGSRGCGSPRRGPPRLLPFRITPPPDGAQATGSPVPGLLPAPEPPRPGLTGLPGGHSTGTSPGLLEGRDASGRGPGGLGRSPLAEFVREPAPRHRVQGGSRLGRDPVFGLVPPPDGPRHPRALDFGPPESGGTEAPFESQLGRKAGSGVAVGSGG